MRRSLLLSVLLLATSLTVGCLGDEPTLEPATNRSVQPASSEVDDARWNRSINGTARYLLAAGDPVGPDTRILVVDGCGLHSFRMPNGTTEATFTVSGPPVNASRPGAGYQTFMVKHDEEDRYRTPEDNDRPARTRTINVSDPRPGKWFVWVWPWGVSVHQVYDIEVALEGRGEAPADALSLEPAGLDCEGGIPDGRLGAGHDVQP